MVEQKRYDVVLAALRLACDTIQSSSVEINSQNLSMLPYMAQGSLVGYFLIKAEEKIYGGGSK